MDSTFSVIPYTQPQQEQSPADWAPFACMSLLALATVVKATMAGSDNEEEHAPINESKPRPQVPGLEDSILAALGSSSCGLRAKDLMRQLRSSHSEIKKGDINSLLYKLLTRKVVAKSSDPTPVWTLAA